MKKRILMAMIVGAMVVSLGACGSQDGSSNTGESNSVTEIQTDNQEKVDAKEETETKEQQDDKKSQAIEVEVSMETLETHAETPASDFEYRIDGDGVTITGYLGDDVIVVLPEEIDGQKVLKINNNVFDGESGVKAVKLSNSIEYIAATFMENKDLQYVICGESLQTIGDGAFNGCTSLVEIQLNEGLEKIGETSFLECTSLKKLYVPETVTDISYISFGMMSEDFTIQGKTGSKAEESASSNGYGFEAVE